MVIPSRVDRFHDGEKGPRIARGISEMIVVKAWATRDL